MKFKVTVIALLAAIFLINTIIGIKMVKEQEYQSDLMWIIANEENALATQHRDKSRLGLLLLVP